MGKQIRNVADDPMTRSSMNAVVKLYELAVIGGDHLISGEHRESIAKIGIGSIQMVI